MLITYYIDGLTSGMKSQSIPGLLSGSEHMYWILGLEVEVHSIWFLWTRRPSRMQVQRFFEVGWGGQSFLARFMKILWDCPWVVGHGPRSLSY